MVSIDASLDGQDTQNSWRMVPCHTGTSASSLGVRWIAPERLSKGPIVVLHSHFDSLCPLTMTVNFRISWLCFQWRWLGFDGNCMALSIGMFPRGPGDEWAGLALGCPLNEGCFVSFSATTNRSKKCPQGLITSDVSRCYRYRLGWGEPPMVESHFCRSIWGELMT